MLENIAASAVPARNADVFTVIWQGINTVYDDAGRKSQDWEDASSFATEITPAEWGFLSVEDISIEEWGAAACGQEHDGDNPYDAIEVLFVLEGGCVIHVDGSDNEPH